MATPTAFEQYMLELVNQARADPGEAAEKYGFSLGNIPDAALEPLAMNEDLLEAARGHSEWMENTDTFSHTGAGGSNPSQRADAAGWDGGGVGENIAGWFSSGNNVNQQDVVEERHGALLRSPGHLANIMNENWSEAGIGGATGDWEQFSNAFLYTQAFSDDGKSFLTGVTFDDGDGDNFYDVGEGLGGVNIEVTDSDGNAVDTSTWEAGGYQIALEDGDYTVRFSGEGINGVVEKQVTIAGGNVKVDINTDLESPVVADNDDTPAEDPTSEDPTVEDPTAEDPDAEEPTTEDPDTDEPTAEDPDAEEPTAEDPDTDEPTAEDPDAEEPTAEDPDTEEPTAEDPDAEEPTAEDPDTDEPTAEDPDSEEPTAEDPDTDEPTAEDPDAEEPTAEDPDTDEPTAEDPDAEEPTAEDPDTDEPTAEDPDAEEPDLAAGPGVSMGTEGDDVFMDMEKDQIILGAAGDDRFETESSFDDFNFVLLPNNGVLLLGADSTKVLFDVETIEFADLSIEFKPEDATNEPDDDDGSSDPSAEMPGEETPVANDDGAEESPGSSGNCFNDDLMVA